MIQQSMSLKVLILPLSLVISVVMVIFFVKPAYTDMSDAKNTMNEEKSHLEKVQAQTQKLEALKSKLNTMQEEKNLVTTAVPEGESADSYVSELSSKASRSGVLLSDIKFEKQTATWNLPTYTCGASPQSEMPVIPAVTGQSSENAPSCLNSAGVKMIVSGNWSQILDFLKYIEDMNRISNIQEISIISPEKTAENTSPDLLSVEVASSVFFMPKIKTSDASLISTLADQGTFNQRAIDKLKEVIFAPYSAPAVTPGSTRNLFQ